MLCVEQHDFGRSENAQGGEKNLIKSVASFCAVSKFFQKQFILAICVTHLGGILAGTFSFSLVLMVVRREQCAIETNPTRSGMTNSPSRFPATVLDYTLHPHK